MLRCKEGDLAVVTHEEPGCEVNIGRMVTVCGPVKIHERFGPTWLIQPVHPAMWAVSTRSGGVVLDRPPYVCVTQERVRTDSGVEIDDYYRVLLPEFAVCVPITLEGMVVTLWQYKHRPKAYSLTLPAGFVEPGEAPDITCRRELLEETGHVAVALTSLGNFRRRNALLDRRAYPP